MAVAGLALLLALPVGGQAAAGLERAGGGRAAVGLERAEPAIRTILATAHELHSDRTADRWGAWPTPTAAEVAHHASRRSFTMAFTGDLLLHTRVTSMARSHATDQGGEGRGYDYRPLLEGIRPWIEQADWAVCHLEVNLSADGSRLASYPAFRAPGQIAHDVRHLGYDSCTTASNHILDYGRAGIDETLRVLDDAGLHHTGAARTPDEAWDQIWVDVGGVRIAHLAYSYWFNGIPLPADAPWASNQIDEDRILADASAARRDGAELVILSLHWGDQYLHEPNPQQRDLGPRLLASPDVDLIIGHHAHVVQPIERLDDEWLVYGLGNLLSNSSQLIRRDELLVMATITETVDDVFDIELEVVPLHLDHATLAVHPTNPATIPAGTPPALAAELEASWERVDAILATGSGYEDLTLG